MITKFRRLGLLAAAALVLSGCTTEMKDQHKIEAYEKSDFYADGMASRAPVEGTVARGHLNDDEHLYKGTIGGTVADSYPFAVTEAVLKRGRERYEIFCSVCHGHTGAGNGMVVQRGFKEPPSFHIERLRNSPAGYFFQVMTNGFGTMYDYAAQIEPADRWAIAAYVRALQLSQNAKIDQVPAAERAKLGEAK